LLVTLALGGVVTAAESQGVPPAKIKIFKGKLPIPADELLSAGGIAAVLGPDKDGPVQSPGEAKRGGHDHGRGGNTFVNDPCLDPPPEAPFPENFRRTVQSETEIAVLNTVKCRPPGNRTPHRREAATCRPWLDAQVEVIDPRVLVTLGGAALTWALGPKARITAARGTVHELRGRALVPTYHPAAAMRFGPRGAPLQALRADLATAAALAQ